VHPRQRREATSSSSLVAQPETGLRSSTAAALAFRIRLLGLLAEGLLAALAFLGMSGSMFLD
jgi:hypothetical protein